MSSPFLSLQGDPIPLEQVLGSGASAVVSLRNGVAVKTPLRCIWTSESDVDMSIEGVQREQDVYRRVQSSEDECSGIVRCLGYLTEATQLVYMAHGDPQAYLTRCRPSYQLQLSWFCEMARTLSYIHSRRVLVTDIASRNIPLDSDLSIRFCDSAISPTRLFFH